MRLVIVGASSLAIMTTRLLLENDHDVVIIDRDKEKIDTLAEELDCGFLHGDGSKPAILREADPGHTHVLYSLTGDDRSNILASLVGRSLGFRQVVTKIEDPELQHICIELGLEDTIIPSRTIGHYLVDSLRGVNALELSSVLKDDARIYTLVARDDDAGPITELRLPDNTRVVCLYRGSRFLPVDSQTPIKPGDEIVLITREKFLPRLIERWGSPDTASRHRE